MASNPFTLSFGMEPTQYISRVTQTDEIIESFTAETPSGRVFMITGVRGSGKTVMLSNLSENFQSRKDWIVINVTPDTDLLQTIAAKLYSRSELQKLFLNAKIDLSAFGLGVTIENANPIFDIGTALEQMLLQLSKHQKRVLIAIDEIVNNQHVKIFASTFQLLIRQKLPVFLLMTGLYENLYHLQNEKTLTFLYRAPKIVLEPLNLNSIARSYAVTLSLDMDMARQMAKLTKGYPFAYQVLGYLYWKKYTAQGRTGNLEILFPEYDEYLQNYVYEKIWFELSPKEKEIIGILSRNDYTKVEDVRTELSLSSGNMSVYRDRLNKKGLLDISRYGYLALKLPHFGEIISIWCVE